MDERIIKYCKEKYNAKHIVSVKEIKTSEREIYRVEMVLEEPLTHTAYKYITISEIEGNDC